VLSMFTGGLAAALIAGVCATLAERAQSRSLLVLSGLAPRMPNVAWLLTIAALALLGVPILSSYTAEVMTFFGAFKNQPIGAFAVAAGLAVRQGRGPADGGRRPDHGRLGRGGLGPSGPRDAVGRGVRSDGRGVGGGHARVVGWAGGGGRGRGRAGFPAAPRPRPPPAPRRRGGEHFDPGRPRVCLREHGQFG